MMKVTSLPFAGIEPVRCGGAFNRRLHSGGDLTREHEPASIGQAAPGFVRLYAACQTRRAIEA
jgi:hypothetical protein